MERQVVLSVRALRDIEALPVEAKTKVWKSLRLACTDVRHPSLQTEKIKGCRDERFECRIDQRYRLVLVPQRQWLHVLLAGDHDPAYRAAPQRVAPRDAPGALPANAAATEGGVPAADTGEDDAADSVEEWLGFAEDDRESLLQAGVPAEKVSAVIACEAPDEVIELELGDDLALHLIDQGMQRQIGPALTLPVSELEQRERGEVESWDLVSIRLAPEHKQVLEREITGPFLVRGSAGSGKTTVAVRRALRTAARTSGAEKVLIVCFNRSLAAAILDVIEKHDLEGRVEVSTIDQWCREYLTNRDVRVEMIGADADGLIRDALREVRRGAAEDELPFLSRPWEFFQQEILRVIKSRLALEWPQYETLKRIGRKSALNSEQRGLVWRVYKEYERLLGIYGAIDWETLGNLTHQTLQQDSAAPTYAEVIVDEAQDFTPARLRICALIAREQRCVYLADATQSIYRPAFQWRDIGMSMKGRTAALTRNLRQSVPIHRFVAALGEPLRSEAPAEDESEEAAAHHPAFGRGPMPQLVRCFSLDDELRYTAKQIAATLEAGTVQPCEIAVIALRNRLLRALKRRLHHEHGIAAALSNESGFREPSHVSLLTCHAAKGLDFPHVYVLDANEGTFPATDDVEPGAPTEADAEPASRKLLFVACSRAIDHLRITYTQGRQSRFLQALPQECYTEMLGSIA